MLLLTIMFINYYCVSLCIHYTFYKKGYLHYVPICEYLMTPLQQCY